MPPQRPNEIEYLTGRLSGALRPSGVTLPGGGGKFATDGTVMVWPGNTFVCHVPRGTQAYNAILAVQDALKMSPYQRFYTFLPAPSFHMTLFQGISPGNRPGYGWPDGVAEGTPRAAVTEEMLRRVATLDLPERYRVKVDDLFAGHSLTVSGADAAAEQELRRARVALRDATGIAFADFDTYVFHITLGYLVDWVSEATACAIAELSAELSAHYAAEIGIIEFGPVEFCTFETMHHFETLRRIGATAPPAPERTPTSGAP
ncbi:MAG: DUF1868 domain-containing protein [Pseudomonadota bacterium]